MKIKNFFLFLLLFAATGCEEVGQKIPQKNEFAPYKQDPVIAYCGRDCGRCHNREGECLRLLRENLTNLCDPKHQNCYELWVEYARRCHKYCTG